MTKTSPYSESVYDPDNKNTTWYKILSFIEDGSTILDVGCSSGRLGKALAEYKNAKVTGIDITAADIKTAQKNLHKAFVFDIESTELSKGDFEKYDYIIFADVLEHMKDTVYVLNKVKELLKPEGKIIFSIPNMAHMFVRLQLPEGRFTYTETGLLDYTHLHFYDKSEVNRIFIESGYEISKYDCTTFDYPEDLLKEKLGNLGLKPTKRFFSLAKQEDAVIFEFIGIAQSQKAGNAARSSHGSLTTSPLDEVLSYVQRVKDSHKTDIKLLNEKVSLSVKHIQKLEHENENLKKANYKLRHSVKAVIGSVVRKSDN